MTGDLTRLSLALADGRRVTAWVDSDEAERLLVEPESTAASRARDALLAITALVERAEHGGPPPTVDQLRRALDGPPPP